ncbi:MAG: PEP-CTERM sorting domain-containing protein [Alphaproteobacteria bacterium]
MIGIGIFAAAMSSAHAIPSTVAGTVISNGSVTLGVINMFDVSSDSAQGAIEFSLAGVSNPVSSALLQVFDLSSATSFPGNTLVNIFGYTGDGALSFAGDFDAGGATSIGSFTFVDGQVAPFEVDVTAFVNSLIGTAGFAGFNLRLGETSEFVDLQGQNGSPDTNPQLILTADNGNIDEVSEPGTVALLGIGLLGICAATRGRKRKPA